VKVFEAVRKLFLAIAVPYQNLADQWVSVLREFNIVPIRCYANSAEWITKLSEYVALYQAGACRFVCLVVVNRTLQSEQFQQLIQQVPGDSFLFIGDECHHHGARGVAASLPQEAKWRLGLSATPEHYMDRGATERIEKYYGSIVSTYTLEEA